MRDMIGYPAYAGIDPIYDTVGIPTNGLPRIRGDRPASGKIVGRTLEATPHTRGSTPLCRMATDPMIGYPAYAGIDPKKAEAIRSTEWLPRIRGDRPILDYSATARYTATPHTRGSTHTRVYTNRGKFGYPAYAGIDLYLLFFYGVVTGLPRIRGDRPTILFLPVDG